MNLDPSAAGRIRIVLVGTQHPGNIGSAARALKTMGLDRLVLVAPQRFPHADAIAMAAGADDVLEAALRVQTDRKSVVEGKRVSVRVDFGGRRSLKTNKTNIHTP